MANKKIAGITVEIGGDTTKLSKALSDVDKKSRDLKNELKDIDKALKLDPKNVELLAQKQKVLAEAITNSKKKLETLRDTEKQIEQQFKNGEIDDGQYRAFKREIEATEAEIKNTQKDINDLKKDTKNAATEMGEAFEKAGEKISKAGEKISDVGEKLMPVSAAVTAIGGMSVKGALKFEDSMAKLSTIADESEVPLADLEKQIKSLSDTTGISAAELAENTYNAISAGQKTADAVDFVAQSTRLATAGFAESGAALDVLTTILNAYGMEASEVNHVSDVLINTQNLGKTTVAELSSSMGKVIPTAKAAGVSLENIASSYAIMTANGIATAESTTYLNSLINELSKSGTKSSDAIKNKTGKSFQQLMADGNSLADVLATLQSIADENNVSMNDLFGSAEAGKAAMTLLSGGADEFNGTLKSMQTSTGATDKAFEKLDTTSRKASIAINQVKNSAIELGTVILRMLQPAITTVTAKIKELTNRFNNLSDSQKKTIVKIGGVVAAIAPALIAIGKVTSGIGGIISTVGSLMKSLGSVMTFISANPVALVIAGIAAVVAAGVVLYQQSEDFRELVNYLVADIAAFAEVIVADLKDMWQSIQPILQDIWEIIQDLIDILEKPLSAALIVVEKAFKATWTAIKIVWDAVIPYFTVIVDGIKNVFKVVKGVLTGDFQGAWDGIKAVFGNTKQFFSGIWDGIKEVFSTVGKFFKETFSAAWSGVKDVFSKGGKAFEGITEGIYNAFKKIVDSLIDGINEVVTVPFNAINKVLGKIKNIKIVGAKPFKWMPTIDVPEIPHLPELAKGGTLTEGQAIIAEAGPELIQLLNGKAKVTPLTGTAKNTSVQSTAQPRSIYQTFNVYVKEFSSAQDARTTSQELARLQRQGSFGKGLAPV